MEEPQQRRIFDAWMSQHRGLLFKVVNAYAFSERLYELEWANDGTKAHELTAAGPPGRGAPSPDATPPPNPHPGPLSLVLDSVSGVGQRRAPSVDRPTAAALPEVVRGERPRGDTNALLAGLGGDPRKPPPKPPSDPELAPPSSASDRRDITPRSGQVVILAGRGSLPPHEAGAPTTPRAATAPAPRAPARPAAAAPRSAPSRAACTDLQPAHPERGRGNEVTEADVEGSAFSRPSRPRDGRSRARASSCTGASARAAGRARCSRRGGRGPRGRRE